MCTASGLSEITIDCVDIDDPSFLQCSFVFRTVETFTKNICRFMKRFVMLQNLSEHMHAGFVPMVLTIDVSPAGSYALCQDCDQYQRQ